MTKGPQKPNAANDREARLKAALRANLNRRKDQSRARSAPEDPPENEQQGQDAAAAGQSSQNEE